MGLGIIFNFQKDTILISAKNILPPVKPKIKENYENMQKVLQIVCSTF
jgi:hypothetical protein